MRNLITRGGWPQEGREGAETPRNPRQIQSRSGFLRKTRYSFVLITWIQNSANSALPEAGPFFVPRAVFTLQLPSLPPSPSRLSTHPPLSSPAHEVRPSDFTQDGCGGAGKRGEKSLGKWLKNDAHIFHTHPAKWILSNGETYTPHVWHFIPSQDGKGRELILRKIYTQQIGEVFFKNILCRFFSWKYKLFFI